MREILFRGKRVDTGEWVEGYYFKATHHWHKHGVHEDWIAVDSVQNGGWCNVYRKYAIVPETLGQFTGLTDNNGKRIFWGDIVRVKGSESDENWKDYDEIGKVVFVDGAFLIEVPQEYNGMKYYSKIHSHYMTTADWVTREVIGNIHDNGERLFDIAENKIAHHPTEKGGARND